MIIDFRQIESLNTFIEKLLENRRSIFDLKNVKVCKDVIVSDFNDVSEISSRIQSLAKRDLLVIDEDNYVVRIPEDTVCSIEKDDHFVVVVGDEKFDISSAYLPCAAFDIKINELGRLCLDKIDDNIEHIFETIDIANTVNNLYKQTNLGIFRKVFEKEEVISYLKNDMYNADDYPIDENDFDTEMMEIFVEPLRKCLSKVKNITDSVDDFAYTMSKDIIGDILIISGNVRFCAYTDQAIKFDKIENALTKAKFDKFAITDVYQPSNTYGISMDGVYNTEDTTFIGFTYKMSYKFR